MKIDHVGIAVESIAQARQFYESMGLHVENEETVEHEGVRTAMIPVGESRVELLEPTSPDTTVGRYLAKRGQGIHHVALATDDIARTFAAMKAAGVRLVSDEIKRGAGGHQYFFVHPSSAGGVLVEVVQPE